MAIQYEKPKNNLGIVTRTFFHFPDAECQPKETHNCRKCFGPIEPINTQMLYQVHILKSMLPNSFFGLVLVIRDFARKAKRHMKAPNS